MGEFVEVIVGVLGRAHGVRGEISVNLRTDEPQRRFFPGAKFHLENGGRQLTLESARWHGEKLLAAFVEIPDRNAAEALTGEFLAALVDAAEVPQDPEEFYDRHLIGLRVFDHAGVLIGEIDSVLHLPGQDLLSVISAASSAKKTSSPLLVPFTKAVVPQLDLAGKKCVLADIPGLLGEFDEEEKRRD